jgi:hypothetical protein
VAFGDEVSLPRRCDYAKRERMMLFAAPRADPPKSAEDEATSDASEEF